MTWGASEPFLSPQAPARSSRQEGQAGGHPLVASGSLGLIPWVRKAYHKEHHPRENLTDGTGWAEVEPCPLQSIWGVLQAGSFASWTYLSTYTEWGTLRLPANGYPQNCSSLSTLKPSDLGRALPDWMGAASPSKHQGLGAMCPSPSSLVTFGEVVGQ